MEFRELAAAKAFPAHPAPGTGILSGYLLFKIIISINYNAFYGLKQAFVTPWDTL
jgi:hypothetical protein